VLLRFKSSLSTESPTFQKKRSSYLQKTKVGGSFRINCGVQRSSVHSLVTTGIRIAHSTSCVTQRNTETKMRIWLSRRPPTAEARVRSRGQSLWDLWWTKWHWDRFYPPSTSVSPCQFHSTGAPLLGTIKKTDHLSLHFYHRVAQEALRLRCVRSFCCGALLKIKCEYVSASRLITPSANVK
jgi:hypothetical protein